MTGYCMGGALSIASGVLVPLVDAVVAFYGTPSSELADPSKAKAPIQAHFGEHDSFVGFSDVTVRPYLTSHLSLLLRHSPNIHDFPFCFVFLFFTMHTFHRLMLLFSSYCCLYLAQLFSISKFLLI